MFVQPRVSSMNEKYDHCSCRCRDVPVRDIVQLHGGRGVHGPRHAASERRERLRGRQGVHHQSGHRSVPLRAEQRKKTHDIKTRAM